MTAAYRRLGAALATTVLVLAWAPANAHAADTTPPGPVAAFAVTQTTQTSIALSWHNPSDPDLAAVVLRRAVGVVAPATPADGTLVGEFPPGTTSYADTSLVPQTRYSYSAFARDAVPNYSGPASITQVTAPLAWQSPTDPDPYRGRPAAVSCATSTFCMSVDDSGQAVRYYRGAWDAPVRLATPPRDRGGFRSVSCRSTSFCVAVDGTGNAFRYNGRYWTAPARALPNHSLASVSCVRASFCVAVGGNWATTFNGKTWSTPRSFGNMTEFASVSCTSTTFCMAVGNVGSQRTSAYGWRWNGRDWGRAQRLSRPGTVVWSVSCVGTRFCMAGEDLGNTARFDGTRWKQRWEVSANDFNAISVSCSSPRFCMAGGWTFAGPVVARRYNGSSWSARVTLSRGAWAIAVSCAATTCTSVDPYGFTRRFDGRAWRAPRIFDNTQGDLRDVSCAAVTFCVAIDGWANFTRFDGATWSPPRRVSNSAMSLSRISCPAVNFCLVVDDSGLAWVYDGRAWTPRTATPMRDIQALSCADSTWCVAIDRFGHAAGFFGTRWGRPTLIDPASRAELVDISCTRSRFCAVTARPSHLIIYNNGRWGAPQVLSSNPFAVAGVSCVDPQFCLMPMYSETAATYAGGVLSHLQSPSPPAAFIASCLSVTLCVGVVGTTAFTYNGTTVDSDDSSTIHNIRPNPEVRGLSCVAQTFCAAVGWFGATVTS